jgi:hypothetical protein
MSNVRWSSPSIHHAARITISAPRFNGDEGDRYATRTITFHGADGDTIDIHVFSDHGDAPCIAITVEG